MKYINSTLFLIIFLSFSLNTFSQREVSKEQIEKAAKANGVSSSEISKLKQEAIKANGSTNSSPSKSLDTSVVNESKSFGHNGNRIENDSLIKNPLFGFDFFSNKNISFTPNLNLATPETYELGPGDELLIDIWGAAENSYNAPVNREGAIKLENVGPVFVSGLSIKEAKNKIISSLKKIYYGIRASKSSYNKVNVDISLVNVRTVQVNIIGEVKAPGTYSLSALSSVLNGLYASGGPTLNGTFRSIKVYRSGKLVADFDIYKYIIDGNQKGNILLRDQDVVIVSPYKNKITIEGNVKRTGYYEMRDGENFNDLVRYFSGFKSNAYKDIINVERIQDGFKKIIEIDYKTKKAFSLQDGDILTIGTIVNEYKNRVSIKGAVYRPGNYELKEELTVRDLIQKAGLKSDAFLQRGIIYRKVNLSKKKVIPFSISEVLKGMNNIKLENEDEIQLFNEQSLKEKYTFSISGAVNKPQTIPFVENMLIEDFIAVSGGFKEGADVNVIDVFRRVNDDDLKTISKNIKRSSSGELLVDSKSDFYLQPFDKVYVRYLKGFALLKTATIKGEVNYPGDYSIIDKNEKISDLLNKAGGLSPYAYISGATLIRKASAVNDKETSKFIEEYSANIDSIVTKKKVKVEFKIGINLQEIIDSKGSKYDLILKEGDVLFIPSEKETVEVRGEVLAPSAVRFDKSNSFKKYINSSGGFSESARKSKAYAIYSNGDIKSTKRFLFFKSYPKLKPGSIIIVPNKAKARNPLSIQEVIGITTGIATLGILINTLVK